MLKKITENVEIHQTLPDTPNLTSEELKKEWDKGSKIIKGKFNELIDLLNDAEVLELKEKFDYSTEEKVVGTWIDGKPIYRKVYYATYPSTIIDTNINIGFNNWDEVITLKGLSFSTSDHSVFPIPGIRYYQGTLAGLQLSIVDRNSDWKPNTFYVYTENFAIDKCIIIFEYTKTTD